MQDEQTSAPLTSTDGEIRHLDLANKDVEIASLKIQLKQLEAAYKEKQAQIEHWLETESGYKTLLKTYGAANISSTNVPATPQQVKNIVTFQTQILHYLAEGVCLTDEFNIIFYTNPAFDKMFGYDQDELLGQHIWKLNATTLQESQEKTQRVWAELASQTQKQEWHGTFFNRRKNNTTFTSCVHITKLVVDDKKFWISIREDITEREQVSAELHRREQEFKALLENNPDIVSRIDLQGHVLYVNQAIETMMNVPPQVLLGKRAQDLSLDSDVEQWQAVLDTVAKTGREKEFEYNLPSPQSPAIKYYLSRVVPEFAIDGKSVVSLLVITRDITALKTSEKALKAERDFALQVMNSMGQGLTVVDKTGRVEFANPAYAAMVGYAPEEIIGKVASDFIHPADRLLFKQVINLRQDRVSNSYETRIVRSDGKLISVLNTGVPRLQDGELIGSIAVITDLTPYYQAEAERTHLERKLLETQKLESLGLLAGGIAHDFNNLLVGILSNAELAGLEIEAEADVKEYEAARPNIKIAALQENLAQIKIAAQRAAELARQMLAYSGRGQFIIQPLDLNLLIQEMTQLLETSLPKNVTLHHNLSPGLPQIQADATQIRQLVMNLIVNAGEAIGTKTGSIMVNSSLAWVDKEYLLEQATPSPTSEFFDHEIGSKLASSRKAYLFLEIKDTGSGMDAATLAKIFEPFFTTKFTGRGLGLAAVLGIVRGHKGLLKVTSEPGQGTSFQIWLPAIDITSSIEASGEDASSNRLNDNPRKDEDTTPTEQNKAQPQQNATPDKRNAVLIIDDEEVVRKILALSLTRASIKVIVAENGQQGIELFALHHAEIALVLLDLTMPHPDGAETWYEIVKLDPTVRVILMSGYDETEAVERLSEVKSFYNAETTNEAAASNAENKPGLAGFLQKPFTQAELMRVVQQGLAKD